MAVNPGVNEGLPSGDKWWLLQINKPHESSKNGSGCHVFGFWLDEEGSEEDNCRYFHLLSTSVKVYFGSIIKNFGTPVLIPVGEIVSGWRNGRISYAFTVEYCMKLANLSNVHRAAIEGNSVLDDSESDSQESETLEDHTEEVDDVAHDLAMVTFTDRRRAVRISNSEGQTLVSYKDLARIRNSTRQRRRNGQLLKQVDELVSAQRNYVEFE